LKNEPYKSTIIIVVVNVVIIISDGGGSSSGSGNTDMGISVCVAMSFQALFGTWHSCMKKQV